jgi:YVTN family beta-propeller protein
VLFARPLRSVVLAAGVLALGAAPFAADTGVDLPTGMRITPLAAPGASFERLATGLRADGNADATDASALALSPDGKLLLVLTSGYNLKFAHEDGKPIVHEPIDPKSGGPDPDAKPVDKAEWVFVYDVASGEPEKRQQIAIPNTYDGIAWRADGLGFYVSGGIDDRIYTYVKAPPGSSAPFVAEPAYVLGHNSDDDRTKPKYDGGFLAKTPAAKANPDLPTGAVVAELAPSADGRALFAANLENDSLSIVDTRTHAVTDVSLLAASHDTAQGEFPYGVAVLPGADGSTKSVFVSSLRDDQVLAVHPHAAGATVTATHVCGAPNALAFSHDRARLFAVCGNADGVAELATNTGALVRTISLARPGDPYRGANPNAIAVAPDDKRLYVSLGGENAVAVVDLASGRVVGRIPTGWYPTGVAISPSGAYLYV